MSRILPVALGLTSLGLWLAGCQSSTPTAPTGAETPSAAAGSSAPAASAHVHQGTSHASHGASAGAALGPEASSQIAELRRVLAPFHNFDKAVEAGYSVPVPGPEVCISDPARGGMGYHYTLAGRDLIGDGVVNLLEPEFIVYSPTANGGLRLSSADYFVPYDTWAGPEPPSLLGVPFAREDAFGAYVLHIWAFWPNPAGMFENYNPDVPQCPE